MQTNSQNNIRLYVIYQESLKASALPLFMKSCLYFFYSNQGPGSFQLHWNLATDETAYTHTFIMV